MNVLITGAEGQLGRALLEARPESLGPGLWAPGRLELDLADRPGLAAALRRFRPRLIINCAAYTQVDEAEREIGPAWAVNALGPAALGRLAADLGAGLIHISTDYVFGAHHFGRPWREIDPPEPLNLYGRSKLAGERALLKTGPHLVLRTSWLYSRRAPNFPANILQWAKLGLPLKITSGQTSCPTSAHDLAQAIWVLAERWRSGEAWPAGLYHLAGAQAMNRLEWARSILDLAGLAAVPLEPVPEPFRLGPALRPAYSALDSRLAARRLGLRLPSFQASFPEVAAGGQLY